MFSVFSSVGGSPRAVSCTAMFFWNVSLVFCFLLGLFLIRQSPPASPFSRTSVVAMSSETAPAAMASTAAEGSSAPEDTLQAQATVPEPQGQGAEDTGATAVRELLLKMSSGPVRLRIHESCPISVLKMIYAGESFHRLKINYLHVSLASQMAIRALPPTAYVWLDWSEGPAPGPDPWWKPTWKVIKETLEQEWGMTCPDGIVIQTEAQTTPYIRSKKTFTAMVILPDGRWYAEIENGGTFQDLKASQQARRAVPWRGGPVPRDLWMCQTLASQMTVSAGAGLTVLAIPPVVSHILPAIPMKGENVAPTKKPRTPIILVEMVSSQRLQEEESMSSHPGTDMTSVEKWQ